MKLIHLRKKFPGHVAFNLGLLIRGLRPVIQLDNEDAALLPKVRRELPGVNVIIHNNGTLLFFDVPEQTRAHLDAIGSATSERSIIKHVGDALKLVCSTRDTSGADFRILLGVTDIDNSEHYFKAQMCTKASKVKAVFEEMLRYESLADEMGMIATTLKIIRIVPKLRTW